MSKGRSKSAQKVDYTTTDLVFIPTNVWFITRGVWCLKRRNAAKVGRARTEYHKK